MDDASWERLGSAKKYLPERHWRVLELRFLRDPPETYTAIGHRMGITTERVRQLEKQGVVRLISFAAAKYSDTPARSTSQCPMNVHEIPIEDLQLNVRSYNCIKRYGVETVGDLTRWSEADLCSISNFGRKSLEDVREALSLLGLTLREESGEA